MPLTFACWGYDRTEAMRSGAVEIEGFDVECIESHPRETFDRMGSDRAFSSAEFSFTEFVLHFARGDSPFVAIPAFPSKVFRHGFIFVNRDAGIRAPKDLEGRRVGVPLYTMTAALWQRGILQDEYGVDWRRFHWVQGAMNHPGSHGSPTKIPALLKPVEMETADPARSLSRLLADGDVDAVIGAQRPAAHPAVKRLFPDFRAAERDYYVRTHIFPIMHLVAIRRDVHEANPGFAQALYDALCRSKTAALEKLRFSGANCVMMPFLAADVEEIDEIFDGDAYSYGIEPNRETLETMIRYMVEQDYIPETIPVDDLFVDVKAPS